VVPGERVDGDPLPFSVRFCSEQFCPVLLRPQQKYMQKCVGGEPCQAVLHLSDCGKTLLWLFPNYPPSRMSQVWGPIPESFQSSSGPRRDWSAFGISCSLTDGFETRESSFCLASGILSRRKVVQHQVINRFHACFSLA